MSQNKDCCGKFNNTSQELTDLFSFVVREKGVLERQSTEESLQIRCQEGFNLLLASKVTV